MNWIYILLLASGFGTSLETPTDRQTDEETLKKFGELTAAWQARSVTTHSLSARVEVRDAPYSRFANRQSEWIPKVNRHLKDDASTLNIEDSQLRQDSVGWTYDEHMMGTSIFDYQRDVGDFLGLRKRLSTGRFKRSLCSHFMNVKDERRDPQRYIFTYDGKNRSNFWDGNGDNHPRRIFQRAPEPDSAGLAYRSVYFESMFDGGVDLDHLLCQPLIFHFRPFDPGLGGIYLDNCFLSGRTIVNGRNCWVLQEQSSIPDEYRRFFFVDPERDWIITRYIGETQKHGKLQFDVDAVQDPGGLWMPKRWQILRVESTDRPVQSFVSAELCDYSINPKQALDVTQPTIPAGTWNIQMWVYTIQFESLQSLTRADGTERQVLELETDTSTPYEILMNSEVGQGYFEEQRRLRWGVLHDLGHRGLALVFGFLLCLWAVYPWRSTAKRSSESSSLEVQR